MSETYGIDKMKLRLCLMDCNVAIACHDYKYSNSVMQISLCSVRLRGYHITMNQEETDVLPPLHTVILFGQNSTPSSPTDGPHCFKRL